MLSDGRALLYNVISSITGGGSNRRSALILLHNLPLGKKRIGIRDKWTIDNRKAKQPMIPHRDGKPTLANHTMYVRRYDQCPPSLHYLLPLSSFLLFVLPAVASNLPFLSERCSLHHFAHSFVRPFIPPSSIHPFRSASLPIWLSFTLPEHFSRASLCSPLLLSFVCQFLPPHQSMLSLLARLFSSVDRPFTFLINYVPLLFFFPIL